MWRLAVELRWQRNNFNDTALQAVRLSPPPPHPSFRPEAAAEEAAALSVVPEQLQGEF